MDALRNRTSRDYFDKTYPLQARTLGYSARSFPAYRFILPEVMTEDWLAIVDWGKFQRDHVLHQPLCGYIVLKLLDESEPTDTFRLPDGRTLIESCVEIILRWEGTAYIRDFLLDCGMSEDDPLLNAKSSIAKTVWRTFFREAAYVAAIFHDLGYPWQYAERLQGNLDGMNAPAVRQNRSAPEIAELFGHRLLFHALRGYQKRDAACPSAWHGRVTQLADTALAKTHGLPGALGFLHLNDCVRRYPSSPQSPLHLLCVEWAAVAIMMHDMSSTYWGKKDSGSQTPENPFLRLRFDQDPLSALVTLADVIEEFDRPAVAYGRNGNLVTLEYNKACSGTELELDLSGVLTLRYRMDTLEMLALKRRGLAKEHRTYFAPQYGYLDMDALGIREIRMTAS